MKQIERLDLQQQIIEMRAKGLSSRDIAKELSNAGIEASHMSVFRFLKSSDETSREVISRSFELQEKLAEQKLDVHEQLLHLFSLVKGKLDELENSTDHRSYQGYLRELRELLQFIAKLTGELTGVAAMENNEPMIVFRINQALSSLIAKFADEGKITINDPELQHHYNHVKLADSVH